MDFWKRSFSMKKSTCVLRGVFLDASRNFLRAPALMENQVPRRGPLLDRLLKFLGTILDANPPKNWSDFRYNSYDRS